MQWDSPYLACNSQSLCTALVVCVITGFSEYMKDTHTDGTRLISKHFKQNRIHLKLWFHIFNLICSHVSPGWLPNVSAF